MMNAPKQANFLAAEAGSFRYLEKSNPRNSNLQFLTYGIYELSQPSKSGSFVHLTEESLLFCWKGAVVVMVNGSRHQLEVYDVLYVPRGAAYSLEQKSGESTLILCRAAAEKSHPVYHARWKEISQDERRIRH